MKLKKKKYIIILLIIFISIGFAVLTANLNILTNLSFKNNTWDVHFENVKLENYDIGTPEVNLENDTSISFSGTFKKPGDYIEFTFNVVNGGTINAQLESISTSLTTDQQKYIDYTLTYDSDNSSLLRNDLLYAGQARKIKARFSFKYDIENIPSFENLEVTISLKYIQPKEVSTTVWNYDFAGMEQVFYVPKTGNYKIETWGAQGGSSVYENDESYRGGYGAYATGNVLLEKEQILYIYVGGMGKRCICQTSKDCCGENGGYNGGGNSMQYSPLIWNGQTYYGSGGGATHIATKEGLLSTLNPETDLEKILIVASGGGGASNWKINTYNFLGGSGGGIEGTQGIMLLNDYRTDECTGGNQLEAGLGYRGENVISLGSGFGIGGYAEGIYGPGGGGGLYGGGTSEAFSCGGSSYIGNTLLKEKVMYCYKCKTSTEESTKTNTTDNVSQTPTSQYAKIGNGHVRITYIG